MSIRGLCSRAKLAQQELIQSSIYALATIQSKSPNLTLKPSTHCYRILQLRAYTGNDAIEALTQATKPLIQEALRLTQKISFSRFSLKKMNAFFRLNNLLQAIPHTDYLHSFATPRGCDPCILPFLT